MSGGGFAGTGSLAPATLVARGNAAYERRDYTTAERIFQGLADALQFPGWSYFQLGRIAQARELHAEALKHFVASRQQPDPPSWNGYEELRTLIALRRSADLPDAFARFMADAPDDLSIAHVENLLPVAHGLYGTRPEVVAQFYRVAIRVGSTDYLAQLRDVEAHERSGELSEAAAKLEVLRPRLDVWGHAAEARILSKLGRHAEASDIFERLCQGADGGRFLDQYYEVVLSRSGDADRLDRFFEIAEAAGVSAGRMKVFRFRRAVTERNEDLAVFLLQDLVATGNLPSKWQLIELLYLAIEQKHVEGHTFVYDVLDRHFPEDADAIEAMVNRWLSMRAWDEAEILLDRLAPRISAHRAHIVDLKRFELACFRHELDRAGDLLDRLGPLEAVPLEMLPSVYRYLAETGEWNTIFDDAVTRLGGRFGFATIGVLIVGAARRSRRRRELLALIEAIPEWQEREELRRIYAAIAFDCLMKGDVAATEAAPEVSADTVRAIASADDLIRLDAFRRLLPLPAATPAARRTALFMCTNRQYLIGSAVTLATLLLNNPEAGQRFEIIICASAECLVRAREVLGAIADRYGATLTYLDAADVCGGAELKSAYGLFTGGQSLAVEAYWRIYVARYLVALGQHDRAVYIDSDVAIGPRFLEILDLPIDDDVCLIARPEVDREEVRAATQKHRLVPGTYFNSGVLLIDLRKAETPDRLSAAIVVAETESERLMFQDQCALNIGFAGATAPLDECFNRFSSSADDEATVRGGYATAGVFHFLDRPKPWDPLYRGAAGDLWLDLWRLTISNVPETQIRLLLAEMLD